MTRLELCVVLAWLLMPPLVLGLGGLLFFQRRVAGVSRSRRAQSCVLLLVLSYLFAFAEVALGPTWMGRYLGIRDNPVMWAPFAFLAVAAALPFSIWWTSRRPTPWRAD